MKNAVADIISDWTKIPVQRLTEGRVPSVLRTWKRLLKKRVIGQDEAVSAVAQRSQNEEEWA